MMLNIDFILGQFNSVVNEDVYTSIRAREAKDIIHRHHRVLAETEIRSSMLRGQAKKV